jgi:hypothetical protein
VSASRSALRRFAQRGPVERDRQEVQERCDLCGEPLAAEHRHLVDLQSGHLLCACRACSLLFDREAAGGGHYRLVGERRLRVEDFVLDDQQWASFGIPVDMAFFVRDSGESRVRAFYPGPMGAAESRLPLDTWSRVEDANPVVTEMKEDVEALLVNRARGAREHWVVPLDVCYSLVGLMRMHWKGLSGGDEVWKEIASFLDTLQTTSRTVSQGRQTNGKESA